MSSFEQEESEDVGEDLPSTKKASRQKGTRNGCKGSGHCGAVLVDTPLQSCMEVWDNTCKAAGWFIFLRRRSRKCVSTVGGSTQPHWQIEPWIQKKHCGLFGQVMEQWTSYSGGYESLTIPIYVSCGLGEDLQLCPLRNSVKGAAEVQGLLLRAIQLPYNQTKSCVYILGTRSSLFKVHAGPYLSPSFALKSLAIQRKLNVVSLH